MSRSRADLSLILHFIIFTTIWGTTWIVIRDQLGTVPPQWSVAYRFVIAAAAAHELGTPLATIALVAKEMDHAMR